MNIKDAHGFADIDAVNVADDWSALLAHIRDASQSPIARLFAGILREASLKPAKILIRNALLDQEAAQAQVRQLAELPGWLRRQSSLELHPDDRDNSPNEPPIQGEWGTDSISFSLRLLGPDRWRLVEISEVEASDATPEAAPVLAQTVTSFGRERAHKLVHRVYFGADSNTPTALRRICCRLTAIEPARDRL